MKIFLFVWRTLRFIFGERKIAEDITVSQRIAEVGSRTMNVLLKLAVACGVLAGVWTSSVWAQRTDQAATCLGVVSLSEAGVLGNEALALVDNIILNRARHIHHAASFDQAVCLAAWGQHINTHTGKPIGNFSGTRISVLKSQFSNSPNYSVALANAEKVARNVLISTKLPLPPAYIYYHSFDRGSAGAKRFERGRVCDRHIGSEKSHLIFCRSS